MRMMLGIRALPWAAGIRDRHGALNLTLLVNDLKLGDRSRAVALWIGIGTEAYYLQFATQAQIAHPLLT